MKKSSMLPMVLALVLSATAAFAGLTTTPPISGLYATVNVINQSGKARTLKTIVSAPEGAQAQSFTLPAGGVFTCYIQGDAYSYYTWYFQSFDEQGVKLAEAVVDHRKKNFFPRSISEGIEFESGEENFCKLTLTR